VHFSPLHYFPVTPLFMLLMGVVLAIVIALVEVGVIGHAYEKMGIRRQYVFSILMLTLLGIALSPLVAPVVEIGPRGLV
jgi:hypothetical protein